jgi:hypothetical protein
VAAPLPPVEPRAKVVRTRAAVSPQGAGDAPTVAELATCEQTLAQVRLLAPRSGLPELGAILGEVISTLRRVPGVSAELDRRAGR